MKKTLLAIAAAALMAGCSSGVKLDEVPVNDAQPVAVAPGAAPVTPSGGGSAAGAGQTRVEPVNLTGQQTDTAGPAGVGRVVYFDYDSFVIKPEAQALIESHARFIRGASNRKVVVEGHTDERGGREYNLALGQKRSEAVRRALGLLGVGDSQVEAVSFGEEKPAQAGMSEDAFARNRRAEITYR